MHYRKRHTHPRKHTSILQRKYIMFSGRILFIVYIENISLKYIYHQVKQKNTILSHSYAWYARLGVCVSSLVGIFPISRACYILRCSCRPISSMTIFLMFSLENLSRIIILPTVVCLVCLVCLVQLSLNSSCT